MSIINYENITKLYYSIGEVAALFGVSSSLIRFWEKEFTIIQPQKSKGGRRKFTPKDIQNLEKVYLLVKQNGYTIDGAKKALSNKKTLPKNESTTNLNETVIQKLEGIKQQLKMLTKC